ncbi:unnamed protein product [Rotaria sordida]|uniref:Uncharacterized protein n=1 Tax=Rotaria sordida TaxID=392033 RepID=A0A815QI37_9BILA|nr:unnamed protein product [Rotaria sordida]
MSSANKSTNCFAENFGFIYTWRDDFRFSSHVISVYAAISLLLFFITVQALVRMPPRLVELRPHIQTEVDVLVAIYLRIDPNLQTDKDQSSNFRLPNVDRPYIFAIIFTLLVIITQLLIMLASIRRNLLQTFGDDHSEIPVPKFSENVTYVTGNFRFAGTFIGYVILGYVF